MGNALFDSIVSKVAIHVPMFAKAIVEGALEKLGTSPFAVTPAQMKKALDEHVLPKLRNFVSLYREEETMGGGIIRTNRENQITKMSRTIRPYVESDRDFDLKDPSLFEKLEGLGIVMKIEAFALRGEDHFTRKINIQKPFQSFLEVVIILVTDNQGHPDGTVSSVRDVTLSEKLSEEVASLYDQLDVSNITLKEQNEKLLEHDKMKSMLIDIANRTKDELIRSNKELEQFAYIASHDLQEPLRMVASFTQLLAARYKDKLDSDGQEFIHFAVDGAKRMQNLINGLLQYSRVGTKARAFEPVDCEVILKEVLRSLSLRLTETNTVVTNDPLPLLLADKSQLAQCFQNLISNAIKFHGPEFPHIHISARQGSGEWILSFRDNGIGIEPKHFDRIFQIFQRLHRADQYEGTGIGLTICKKIIERHKGKIWVESEKGKGSTFFFTISDIRR